ncbi:ankyrin repeat-containing protein [Corchorus capsularis]|uniref:Ankyrin repeat-containing protein n=1 Tax=Corchorus capsularis TaxID=210143 RepID=A0A1R3J284_COCAP|nr:ankyrin repeat-containing protein [Corchorus capsularis]
MRFNERFAVYLRRHKKRLSDNEVNALLVVAGVILAAIFPFVYNPPGGYLSDDNKKSADVSLNYNNVTDHVNSTLHVNVTSNPNTNSTGAEGPRVAMGETQFTFITIIIETFFLTVLSLITLLLPDGFFGFILLAALMGFVYLYFIFTLVIIRSMGDKAAEFIYYLLVLLTYGACASLYMSGSRTVTRLEGLKYRLMKNRYLERSTIAAAPASGGGDEGMETAAQTTPSASS